MLKNVRNPADLGVIGQRIKRLEWGRKLNGTIYDLLPSPLLDITITMATPNEAPITLLKTSVIVGTLL